MSQSKDRHNHNESPDEALVSATLKGDKGAYRALVERYQARLMRMALDILKNTEDAEDVVQESFVKAFLSLDKFKHESSFYTWLHRITFNMAVDLKRKNQRRGGYHFEYKEDFGVLGNRSSLVDSESPSGDSAAVSQNIEGPQEALIRKETGRKLEQVLAQLSDEHRTVIILREVDGLDYEDIAAALGVPRGTVMSRLFYARKALQQALKEIAPESPGKTSSYDDNDENSKDAKSANSLRPKSARG